MIDIFIFVIHFSMQIQLIDQYSAEEIAQARDEIVQLQGNLNKIEQLYHQLHLTLNSQHVDVEQIALSINHTENNLARGVLDLQKFGQLRRTRTKYHCLVTMFIAAIGVFFLLIVLSVLINVIQTFGYRRITT